MPKNRKQHKLLPSIIIILIAFAGYWGYNYWMDYKSKKAFYKNFGIAIPANFSIHGIDVSKYQSHIYWQHVKQVKVDNIQIGFSFLKATEGLTLIDKKYKHNQNECRKLNLIYGAYHYFKPRANAQQQMQHFIKNAQLQKGDLPPVLDVEETGGLTPKEIQQQVKLCLQLLEKQYKTKPILYSYVHFYENYLGKDFDQYPLWVAHYEQLDTPKISRAWHFWQHSDKGRVNGITEPVDFNVFKGDSSSLQSLLLK